jgi:hypothetical protein
MQTASLQADWQAGRQADRETDGQKAERYIVCKAFLIDDLSLMQIYELHMQFLLPGGR